MRIPIEDHCKRGVRRRPREIQMKGMGIAGLVVMAGISMVAVSLKAQPQGQKEVAETPELRRLMEDGLSASRQGNKAKLREIARTLMIPDYELWFRGMFGDEGARLAAAYGSNYKETEKIYPELFDWLAKQTGDLIVEDVRTLPNRGENWCAQTLSKSLKGNLVLYRVSIGQANSAGLQSGRVAGYFVLVAGAYRRLDCNMLGLAQNSSTANSLPTKIAGDVQAARIISRVEPEYPEMARKGRITGVVRMRALIGKDGQIKKLDLISGHPLLQQAALDAVRLWRYKPAFVNGEPIEVDTTIDVIFSLQ